MLEVFGKKTEVFEFLIGGTLTVSGSCWIRSNCAKPPFSEPMKTFRFDCFAAESLSWDWNFQYGVARRPSPKKVHCLGERPRASEASEAVSKK